MTFASTIRNIALVATLAAAASGAQAMTLHNCTDDPLNVKLMDKNGNYGNTHRISPYTGQAIHATNSYGPYRIVLPQLGPGAHFSNRHGDGVFSLIRTGGGNIGIRDGSVCQQYQPQPAPVSGGGNSGGLGGEVCFKNDLGFQVCLRP